MNNNKIDLKEAFQEFARKELEFYESAKKDTLYTRVLPDVKDKEKGYIDYYYNGIKIGGILTKNCVILNKLKITKFGKESEVEKAIEVIKETLKAENFACDNQLK